MLADQRGDRLGLGRSDLEQRDSAGREQARQIGHDRAIGVEAVGAGEQGLRGLMVADVGRKRLAART